MRLPRAVIASCAVACLSALPALAEERVLRVDGADLAVRKTDPNGLEIYYSTSGVILVRGQWAEGGVLEGEAFRILDDCAPLAYPVRGVVSSAGQLVVVGTAAETCSTEPSGVLAVMRFEAPAEPPRKAKVKAKRERREFREPRQRAYAQVRERPRERSMERRERVRVRYYAPQPQPQYAQQPSFGFFSGWRW
jgi:hypothetical protein